jgi:hypothetical protein
MTPEKINQAIAKACGWALRDNDEVQMHFPGGYLPCRVKRWFKPGNFIVPFESIPNYFADLNACREMEETLDVNIDDPDSPRYAYCHELYRIVPKGQQPFRALAPQRCEAFLRLKGKWVE